MPSRLDVTLAAVLLAALAAPWTGAQVSVIDSLSPFRNFDNTAAPFRGYDQAAADRRGGDIGPVFKLPEAVAVKRPLKLRPQKAVLKLEKKGDPELATIGTERRALLAAIRDKRARNDHAAVTRLLRKMEELRQKRLARLRVIAEKVIPPNPLAAPPPADDGGTEPAQPDKPVLPIPTLPKNSG